MPCTGSAWSCADVSPTKADGASDRICAVDPEVKSDASEPAGKFDSCFAGKTKRELTAEFRERSSGHVIRIDSFSRAVDAGGPMLYSAMAPWGMQRLVQPTIQCGIEGLRTGDARESVWEEVGRLAPVQPREPVIRQLPHLRKNETEKEHTTWSEWKQKSGMDVKKKLVIALLMPPPPIF
jgi:hypothetical protein